MEQNFCKRRDAQSGAISGIKKKNLTNFCYPRLLQCMQIIWVNFTKNKWMEMEFSIKNALSIAVNNILNIYEVKFNSHTFIFGKVYPDYIHALLKQRVAKN